MNDALLDMPVIRVVFTNHYATVARIESEFSIERHVLSISMLHIILEMGMSWSSG